MGCEESFVEDRMDLFPRSGGFETVCCKSFLAEDFEGAVSLFSQLLARSCCGNVGSFQPDLISLVVITSVRSFFVVKCFHRLSGFGECGFRFGSSFGEVVDEVLSRLAFDFSTGFESLLGCLP